MMKITNDDDKKINKKSIDHINNIINPDANLVNLMWKKLLKMNEIIARLKKIYYNNFFSILEMGFLNFEVSSNLILYILQSENLF